VSCPGSDVGCTFSAPRSEIDEHIGVCPLLSMKPILLVMKSEIAKLKEEMAKEVQDLKYQVRRTSVEI
jgi:hypothetical protein